MWKKVSAVTTVTPTDALGIARVEATVPILNSTLAETTANVNITLGIGDTSASVVVPFVYQSSLLFVPQLLGLPQPKSGPITGGKFVRVQAYVDRYHMPH